MDNQGLNQQASIYKNHKLIQEHKCSEMHEFSKSLFLPTIEERVPSKRDFPLLHQASYSITS